MIDLANVITFTDQGDADIDVTFPPVNQRDLFPHGFSMAYCRAHFEDLNSASVALADLTFHVDSMPEHSVSHAHDAKIWTEQKLGLLNDSSISIDEDSLHRWTIYRAGWGIRLAWATPDTGKIGWGIEMGLLPRGAP